MREASLQGHHKRIQHCSTKAIYTTVYQTTCYNRYFNLYIGLCIQQQAFISFPYLVLVGNTVALAGDGNHLRTERGRDKLRRVLRRMRLTLDQRCHCRPIAAVQRLNPPPPNQSTVQQARQRDRYRRSSRSGWLRVDTREDQAWVVQMDSCMHLKKFFFRGGG